MNSGAKGSVRIEQQVEAPLERVAAYISDFRNAREWMVGVEAVEPLGEESFRLTLESPGCEDPDPAGNRNHHQDQGRDENVGEA